jgi:hypothetical protein
VTASGESPDEASECASGRAWPAALTCWRRWEWREALLDALARREITAGAFAIGIALSLFADNRTGESCASVAAIAKRVGAPVYKDNDSRTVRDSLTALERAGLVEIVRRGHMKPNRYRPRCPLVEIGEGGDANDRRITADMIGEQPPTNSSTELPNHSLSLRAVESDEAACGGDDAGLSDKFEEFLQRFPFKASMDRAGAWREFGKLDQDDQELAIRQAGENARVCQRDGVQFPRHPARWLRERSALPNSRIGNAKMSVSSPAPVFVVRGADASRAWSAPGSKGRGAPQARRRPFG